MTERPSVYSIYPVINRPFEAQRTAVSDPLIGLSVANLFVIDALLGVGASARVYQATQLGVGRLVAIKILHRNFLSSVEMRERFHREARISSRIVHPAIVPVLMTGELPNRGPTHGEAFIVYELVDGVTLRYLLSHEQLTHLGECISIVVSAAEAVGAAHELDIVHRDLKPENIMLIQGTAARAEPRILDFGLAKLSESTENPLTHTGAILGTPQYLSPEGARGMPATVRSDVYSLAVVAYECLAGHPPFDDTSPIRILMQHIDGVVPPLRGTPQVGSVPPSIEQVILDNLAKSPDDRAENALAFARQLREAATCSQVAIENCRFDGTLWQTYRDLNSSSGTDPNLSLPAAHSVRRS